MDNFKFIFAKKSLEKFTFADSLNSYTTKKQRMCNIRDERMIPCPLLLASRFLIFTGSHSRFTFEEFVESGRTGEVQSVRNFV